MFNLFGNAIWQLIYQSDKVTWFVLITLFVCSVLCWTILFYKLMIWNNKKRQISQAVMQIKMSKNFEDLLKLMTDYSNTFIGYYLSKNLMFLKSLLETKKNKFEISEREWEFLKRISDNSVDDILYKEESYLPVLSVTAAIAPLLGLFGTIWGLVHSFIDISKKQSADIVTVAPGIAEALITTLAGLMVAIPALIMYYNLKLNLSKIEQSLFAFSDRFLLLIQNIFISNYTNDAFAYRQQTVQMEQGNAQ